MKKRNGSLAVLLAVLVFQAGCAERRDYRDPESLKALIEGKTETYTLVDVRTETEYADGHIPTAQNIPVDVIEANPPQAAKDSLIIVYCRSGRRSQMARDILVRLGYTQVIDFGAVSNYRGELIKGNGK